MEPSEPLRVAVIIGSNREGRFGDTVARWFLKVATDIDGIDVDTIDLADLDLHTRIAAPSPAMPCSASARVDAADAFVVVTPEYNHSFPASVKAFIDQHVEQWAGKVVGFVSYGGVGGGLLSVEALRLVFASLNAATVRNTVTFANVWDQFVEGEPVDPQRSANAAKTLVHQVKWWGHALRDARRVAPLTSASD